MMLMKETISLVKEASRFQTLTYYFQLATVMIAGELSITSLQSTDATLGNYTFVLLLLKGGITS